MFICLKKGETLSSLRKKNFQVALSCVRFLCLVNLVPRVLCLFGQRVIARKDSGIMDSILENVGSGLIAHA